MPAKLERVLNELDALQSIPKAVAVDPSESFIASMRDEIRGLERTADSLLAQHRASLADHELYLQRGEERELKIKQIYDLKNKVQSFKLLSSSQKPPVGILGSVSEPIVPIRPRRAMNIAIGVFLSLALGIGLVCLLEHLDHSVKIPEHLSVGLTLPLLGVVPRIRRTAARPAGQATSGPPAHPTRWRRIPTGISAPVCSAHRIGSGRSSPCSSRVRKPGKARARRH